MTFRDLPDQKIASFWSDKLTSSTSPRDMCMVYCRSTAGYRACDGVSANDLCTFFTEKVEPWNVYPVDYTSGAMTNPAPTGDMFTEFASLTPADVTAGIARLPDKSSAADPLPISTLKDVADLLTPFLTHLFNCSLAVGHFPASFKDSFVTPVLKKPGLDEASPSSYRPISNSSVMSKLLERLLARQFVAYLNATRLLPTTQSGFRRSSEFSLISWMLLTVTTLPFSFYSTSPRHLTPWITEFCWRGCESLSVSTIQR